VPEILALTGLAIATLLYFMLVRRRASDRIGVLTMHHALAASNDVALARMRSSLGRSDPEPDRPGQADADRADPGPSIQITASPPAGGGDARDVHGDWRDGVVVADRRGGVDRRDPEDRRRGRGRRSGADRRRRPGSR
jgi:hypothetical protein